MARVLQLVQATHGIVDGKLFYASCCATCYPGEAGEGTARVKVILSDAVSGRVCPDVLTV